jgi:GNAT superfamily N-acetyltransferase
VDEANTYGLGRLEPGEIEAWLDGRFLVAEADGTVVGFAHGTVRSGPSLAVVPAGEPYLEVEELYVRADSRRRGTGGLLLAAIVAQAREAGVERFTVFSAAHDQHAILRFYERHGFRPWGVQLFK